MKTTKFVALVVLLISAGVILAAQAQEHPKTTEHPSTTEHPAATDDILAVCSAGDCATFVNAIKAAGVEAKLQGKGPFTIFAPTDEAFAKLPAGTLEDLLKPANKAQLAGLLANHVVPGIIRAEDMKTMKATNVSGQDLDIKVAGDAVTVNNAHVVKADMVASNGIIHAIDTVLIPASPVDHPATDAPKDHPAH